MSRSAVNRSKKYEDKLKGSVLEERTVAQAGLQKSGFRGSIARQVELEAWIKSLHLGRNEVYYIIFAKQVNKLMGKFRGGTFEEEVDGFTDVWITRGLTETTLDMIVTRLSGYTPAVVVYGRYGTAKYGVDRYA